MDTAKLLMKMNALPDAQKIEITDFVNFLYNKFMEEKKATENKSAYGKGFIKVSSDFYEPMEDLN